MSPQGARAPTRTFGRITWDALQFEHGDRFNFGFTSKRALLRWFKRVERERLHERGFVVATYSATVLHKSKRQCVFNNGARMEATALNTFGSRSVSPIQRSI